MQPEDYFTNIQETLVSEANTARDVIHHQLVENQDDVFNRLPEHVFVNYFLPFFIGHKTDKENPNWLMEWISIAGSPAASIVIFDPKTKEKLFTVPPVLNTNEVLSRSNLRFAEIVSSAQQHGTNIPIIGARFLFEALKERTQEILSSLSDPNLQAWINIFQRYNLISITNTEPGQASTGLSDLLDI